MRISRSSDLGLAAGLGIGLMAYAAIATLTSAPAVPVGMLAGAGDTRTTGSAGPNRQIAQELAISERTADEHVANILAKLGLQTRAQAAVWVVELPLAHAPS